MASSCNVVPAGRTRGIGKRGRITRQSYGEFGCESLAAQLCLIVNHRARPSSRATAAAIPMGLPLATVCSSMSGERCCARAAPFRDSRLCRSLTMGYLRRSAPTAPRSEATPSMKVFGTAHRAPRMIMMQPAPGSVAEKFINERALLSMQIGATR